MAAKPVTVVSEKGATVYVMPDHPSALALAAENGGSVERRNLWCVVVPKGRQKNGDNP